MKTGKNRESILKNIQLLELRVEVGEETIRSIIEQYQSSESSLTPELMVKIILEEELKITQFIEEIERNKFDLKQFE